jgi:hypothetical protein
VTRRTLAVTQYVGGKRGDGGGLSPEPKIMANVDDGSDHVSYHESWHSSDYDWDDIRMAAAQKQRANDHDARPAFVNSPDGSDDWSADFCTNQGGGGGGGALHAHAHARGVAVHVKPPPGSAAASAVGGYVEGGAHSNGRENPEWTESHTTGGPLASHGLFGMRAGEKPTIYSSSRTGLSADSAFAVAREDSASGGSNALLPNHNAGVGGLCTYSLPEVGYWTTIVGATIEQSFDL